MGCGQCIQSGSFRGTDGEPWVATNNSRDQHSKDPRGPEFESDINQVKPRSDAGRLGYTPKLSCNLWGHKVSPAGV